MNETDAIITLLLFPMMFLIMMTFIYLRDVYMRLKTKTLKEVVEDMRKEAKEDRQKKEENRKSLGETISDELKKGKILIFGYGDDTISVKNTDDYSITKTGSLFYPFLGKGLSFIKARFCFLGNRLYVVTCCFYDWLFYSTKK